MCVRAFVMHASACVCVFGVLVCVMRACMYIMSIVGIHVCIVRVYNGHTSTSMHTWNS